MTEESKDESEFLLHLYGVRSSVSPARQLESASLAASYREVVPRALGRAVNLGVDLPDGEGRSTVRPSSSPHRTRTAAARREQRLARIGDEWNSEEPLVNTPPVKMRPSTATPRSPAMLTPRRPVTAGSSRQASPAHPPARSVTSAVRPGPWSARSRPPSSPGSGTVSVQSSPAVGSPLAWSDAATVMRPRPPPARTPERPATASPTVRYIPSTHFSSAAAASAAATAVSPAPLPADSHPDYASPNGRVYVIRRPGSSPDASTRQIHFTPTPQLPRTTMQVPSEADLDLRDPHFREAHAILCSLLPREAVPASYPYIDHLPVETVLVSPDTPPTSAKPVVGVAHAGRPVSRLVDLHLTSAELQRIASLFSHEPCAVLGRRMEARGECGVVVDALEGATARHQLVDFLARITQRLRQHLAADISPTSLPRLILWNVHFDQAAEVVCRLAAIGARARVVHMDQPTTTSGESGDASVDSTTLAPRRVFTFYSLHISQVRAYSVTLVRVLAAHLRSRGGGGRPNFLFDLSPAELLERAREAQRADVLKRATDQHRRIVVHGARAAPSVASASASTTSSDGRGGWLPPQELAPSTLVSSRAPAGATGLTTRDLCALAPRAQRVAVRKELHLLANQKTYLRAKQADLVRARHTAEATRLALDEEVRTLGLQWQRDQTRMDEEQQALEQRVREAAERKAAEEAVLASAQEALDQRAAVATERESDIDAAQIDVDARFEAVALEKSAVFDELELVAEELASLSLERLQLVDEQAQLANDRVTDAQERERVAQHERDVQAREQRAHDEQARLEAEARRLTQEEQELEERKARAVEERAAIALERESIAAAHVALEEERRAVEARREEASQQLARETDEMKAESARLDAELAQQRADLEQRLVDLRSIENQIHLSRDIDAETARLDAEREKLVQSRRDLDAERRRLTEEARAKEAELFELDAQRIAALDAKSRQLEEEVASKEAKLLEAEAQRESEWRRRLAEEKIAREQDDARRVLDWYRLTRQSKLDARSEASTPRSGPRPSISSNAGGGTGIPAISEEEQLRLLANESGRAAFDATMRSKKLFLTTEEWSNLAPHERRQAELAQAPHAAFDEMYATFLGLASDRTTATPPVYLLLELGVEQVERVHLVQAPAPLIEVRAARGNAKPVVVTQSRLVAETESGARDTVRFRPLLLDVAKLCSLQLDRPVMLRCMQQARNESEPRALIGETQLNLVELQTHTRLPLIHLEKQRAKEGGGGGARKQYASSGTLRIHQSEFFVQSTYGLLNYTSPNSTSRDHPFERHTKCRLRFELRGVDLAVAGVFGASRDIAPFVELTRRDAATATWASQACFRTEVQSGANCTFTPGIIDIFEASYADMDRPILCHLKHAPSMGKPVIVSEFEVTLRDLLSAETREFTVGPADRAGFRPGRLIFSRAHTYSALDDLAKLCAAAGLQPVMPAGNKNGVQQAASSPPPLGLDAVLVENQVRVAHLTEHPQPIAFGRGEESPPPSPSPKHLNLATGVGTDPARRKSTATPVRPLSAGPEKGALNRRR